MARIVQIVAAATAAGAAAQAAEYIPMYQFDMMGGQYFVSGGRTNFNGNALGNVTPAVKLDQAWTLLPGYTVQYQGTKPVTDPVGPGTQWQQRLDNTLGLMAVHADPTGEWRFKPRASVTSELLKETRDEAWNHGLFDYQKFAAGFEVEDMYREPFSIRAGYDFFYIKWPHYQSLESQTGVDPQGNPLGRQTAGGNVLDTINNQFSLIVTRPFPYEEPKASLQGSYTVNYQRYVDQPLVNLAGQYQSSVRQDVLQTLNLGAIVPQKVTLWGDDYRLAHYFNAGLNYNGSNANDFDAAYTQFVPDAYSYLAWFAGPAWTLAWGDEKEPGWVNFGFKFTRTQYLGRLTQDGAGNYGTDHQWQDQELVTLGYAYPIARNFSLRAQANLLWQQSNMQYQALYSYNYATANYMMGFSYNY